MPLIPIAMALANFAPGIIKLLTGSDKAEDVAAHVVGIAQTITGTPDGGRNELSLKNEFTVLITRTSPPPPVATVTNAPVIHVQPVSSPKGQP